MLQGLKVRDGGKSVETSGQALLLDGPGKFPAVLSSATPGVLFIDEIYQLNAVRDSAGTAIANLLLTATENDRKVLTVIVAGYADDVEQKFMRANPGLPSRFPRTIEFEDFDEEQLRAIFLGMVRAQKWTLQQGRDDGSPPPTVRGVVIDTARVAARRIARGAGMRGALRTVCSCWYIGSTHVQAEKALATRARFVTYSNGLSSGLTPASQSSSKSAQWPMWRVFTSLAVTSSGALPTRPNRPPYATSSP